MRTGLAYRDSRYAMIACVMIWGIVSSLADTECVILGA
jgi:hypothetical protein